MRNNRHHAPHDFAVGEDVTIFSFPSKRYKGVVKKITPTQVTVAYTTARGATYDRTFWGATGRAIGGYHSAPSLHKRKPEDFPNE